MRLREVLAGCRMIDSSGDLDSEVLGIAYDSRQVARGHVFVAIRGLRADGNRFVAQAVAAGAAAVVSLLPPQPGLKVAWIQVEDDREALAILSTNFFDRPTSRLHVIGITGTNGKTTTAYLVESILKAAGWPAALFGTVEYRGPGFEYKAERTTPEAPELELLFKKVADGGWKHAVMEVSSHAIDLKRVEGMHFEVVAFTNLSQDHLDYHKDMRSYFLAKKRLFLGLDGKVPRVMVLNMDDPQFQELNAIAPSHVISYGLGARSDVYPSSWRLAWSGIEATLQTPAGALEVRSALPGKLNLYNISAAVGVALGLGVSSEAIRLGIERLPSVPGRFENIPTGRPFRVVVDYAHTDDALEKVLEASRGLTTGRLIVVFGCAGERDRTKRPLMGSVAARLSDLAILTSDNPRGEDPIAIIREVEAGMTPHGTKGATYRAIADRREAIRFALASAGPGDTVIVAGKGHETYQVIGNQTFDFDDRVVVRELLNELAAG
ncbi:MAG TPA: UDP-N-acetylmuramoyl-L-alanyl-D-glutamate--2,6-diaminopimelate ligase [Terriglobia bacterium]|nr:UDP-N-acetylmuramoyl-L-alanyl-D-glutamate--2,6-diaminopimelate ligase [Terriglobia bacterium]